MIVDRAMIDVVVDGKTVIHLVASCGNLEMIRTLLNEYDATLDARDAKDAFA